MVVVHISIRIYECKDVLLVASRRRWWWCIYLYVYIMTWAHNRAAQQFGYIKAVVVAVVV